MKNCLIGISRRSLLARPALGLLVMGGLMAWAQNSPSGVLTNPEVNQAVHFDVSPPLSELAKTPPPPSYGFHLAPAVLHPHLEQLMEFAKQPPVPDGALQTSVGALAQPVLGINVLGVGTGFPGYTVPDAPTDVNLAVGDTQVVQWVNVSYAVFDKNTGATLAGPIAGNQLWAGFGGACQNDNDGDIIAQWDKAAHVWVLTQNVFSSPYMTCIAVSQTPDAMGAYFRYAFSQPGFPDYPKWGLWRNAWYQSQNNFGNGSGFQGARPCAYERAKLLVGDNTAKQICFQTGVFDDSLLPADIDSSGLPPVGQDEVFLGSIDNANPGAVVYEYLFHVNFAVPANSTFTGAGGTIPLTVASYNLGCGGFGACIKQKGTSDLLDSLGDRLMYRLAFRKFPNHETWLVTHSVTAGNTVGARWYEFRAPNTTALAVFQQGTYAPNPAGHYRWMGSLAMDKMGNIALGYSSSGANEFPAVKYTGRLSGDPLGTMEAEATIFNGTGSQTDTSNRWGDYTSMALDNQDQCTFWYTNQYYTVTASFDWSTRLASLKFPNCP